MKTSKYPLRRYDLLSLLERRRSLVLLSRDHDLERVRERERVRVRERERERESEVSVDELTLEE